MAGSHTFVITATDNAGNASQYSDTFTVVGPTIAGAVASTAQGVITWNAVGAISVTSATLMIDGTAQNVFGPYAAPAGVNFYGAIPTLASGSHMYVITATDAAGNSSQYTGTFVTGGGPGPAITDVALSAAQGVISWIAADASGVTGADLRVDGGRHDERVRPVYGTPRPGVRRDLRRACARRPHLRHYSHERRRQRVALHGNVYRSGTGNRQRGGICPGAITWIAAAADGVTSSGIAIDDVSAANVWGPFTVSPGLAYAAPFGSLAAGSHSYIITATDTAGNYSEYTGTFTVAGPTIDSVAVAAAQGLITWSAADAVGMASASLTIDGATESVYGPFASPSAAESPAPSARFRRAFTPTSSPPPTAQASGRNTPERLPKAVTRSMPTGGRFTAHRRPNAQLPLKNGSSV